MINAKLSKGKSIIVWKKLRETWIGDEVNISQIIAKLRIPCRARRIINPDSPYKSRAEWAWVEQLYYFKIRDQELRLLPDDFVGRSLRNYLFTYQKGKKIIPGSGYFSVSKEYWRGLRNPLSERSDETYIECAAGIHFFVKLEHAKSW